MPDLKVHTPRPLALTRLGAFVRWGSVRTSQMVSGVSPHLFLLESSFLARNRLTRTAAERRFVLSGECGQEQFSGAAQ